MANTHVSTIDVDIDTLIPHRRPLRLIDEMIGVEGDSAVSSAVAGPLWPLLADGAANPIVLIELVAQTAAALGGLKAAEKGNGTSGARGLIVGIKSATFEIDRIPLYSRMVTRATTRYLIDNFKEITGVVKIDDRVAAQITLQSVSL